jgi:hypothetical protein
MPLGRRLRACRDRMLRLDTVLALQFSTSSALAGQWGQTPYPTTPIGSLLLDCVIDISKMLALQPHDSYKYEHELLRTDAVRSLAWVCFPVRGAGQAGLGGHVMAHPAYRPEVAAAASCLGEPILDGRLGLAGSSCRRGCPAPSRQSGRISAGETAT